MNISEIGSQSVFEVYAGMFPLQPTRLVCRDSTSMQQQGEQLYRVLLRYPDYLRIDSHLEYRTTIVAADPMSAIAMAREDAMLEHPEIQRPCDLMVIAVSQVCGEG